MAAAVTQVTVMTPAVPAASAAGQHPCHLRRRQGLGSRAALRQEGAALAAGVHGVVGRGRGREVHHAGAIARRAVGHVGLVDQVVDELRVGLWEVE